MNKPLFALGAAVALGAPLVAIVRMERLLCHGRAVILELAPVDPRSLLQGDYMALAYAVTRSIPPGSRDGRLVLRDDSRGVGCFQRLDDGGPLAPGEYRVRFRRRGGTVSIGGNAFFFQEGTAMTYRHARYGELRAGADGEVLLVGLRGESLEPLESLGGRH